MHISLGSVHVLVTASEVEAAQEREKVGPVKCCSTYNTFFCYT